VVVGVEGGEDVKKKGRKSKKKVEEGANEISFYSTIYIT
jgi:hypothetical protein